MPASRELFAIFVSVVLIVPLTYQIARALRTGVLRHSDTESKCVRARQPVRFWSLLMVFVAMDAWLCGVLAVVAQRAWWL